MSNKRNILFLLIALVITLTAQIYFLAQYDHFKAEGGLNLELKIDPQDVAKKYARPSLDYDYVMEDAVRTFETKGGDFLSILTESNKKRLKQPLVKLLNYKEILELNIDSKDEEVVDFLREYLDRNLDIASSVFKRRLEQILNKEVIANYETEELTVSMKALGQSETLKPSVVKLPEVNLGFYECATMSEFGDKWHSVSVLTEPDFVPDSLQELVNLNKEPVIREQTLTNAVIWIDNSRGMVADRDKAFVDSCINSGDVREIFPDNFEFRWSLKEEQNGEVVWYLYLIKIPRSGVATITKEDIARAKLEVNNPYGETALTIRMTHEGTEKWARMTEENINRTIAMCVNETVYSAPRVIGSIADGNTQITGNDIENLKDIETVLNARALDLYPVDFKQEITKGNPPLLNSLVQKMLIVPVVILLVFFGFRYFKLLRAS